MFWGVFLKADFQCISNRVMDFSLNYPYHKFFFNLVLYLLHFLNNYLSRHLITELIFALNKGFQVIYSAPVAG